MRGALVEPGRWMIEGVKRSDQAEGFAVLPKRWIVARTLHGS
ncbi:transposase [Novacetimonas hansenii ATCC 23769]|uniref:Transposase n=1 Tax=Novacetimonas hansenii ATCC 23769 TaxID=714995 RepID=D5QFA5_NOVHA|nr:transposase [Novacetimonas hansenii ATCC 23769]